MRAHTTHTFPPSTLFFFLVLSSASLAPDEERKKVPHLPHLPHPPHSTPPHLSLSANPHRALLFMLWRSSQSLFLFSLHSLSLSFSRDFLSKVASPCVLSKVVSLVPCDALWGPASDKGNPFCVLRFKLPRLGAKALAGRSWGLSHTPQHAPATPQHTRSTRMCLCMCMQIQRACRCRRAPAPPAPHRHLYYHPPPYTLRLPIESNILTHAPLTLQPLPPLPTPPITLFNWGCNPVHIAPPPHNPLTICPVHTFAPPTTTPTPLQDCADSTPPPPTPPLTHSGSTEDEPGRAYL
jgi:hypothetical protein